MCDLSCEFSLLSSQDSLLFHVGLESMSPYFLANLARFRRKGVRFLSPAALFSQPRCVVSCQSSHRCSRPLRCLCQPSSAPPPSLARPPSRAGYAHSASFRLSAFTSSPFAYNRLIYRWFRVKDLLRKRMLKFFVIICRTVCCA